MAGQDYARMLSRGKSFEYSTWQELVKYSNDCFKQDFVSFENALLACKKTHISNVHNRPELIYEEKDDTNSAIGCKSEYWEFVISGIKGADGAKGDKGDKGESGNGNMEIGEGDPINNGYLNDVYLDLKSGTFYK